MSMQLARLQVRTSGAVVTAEVSGEIDMSNAADLRNALIAALPNSSMGLVIDLSDVQYLDSAAIRVIYELVDRLAARGIALRLVVPPTAPTLDALRMSGVPDAVPVHATAAEAEATVA